MPRPAGSLHDEAGDEHHASFPLASVFQRPRRTTPASHRKLRRPQEGALIDAEHLGERDENDDRDLKGPRALDILNVTAAYPSAFAELVLGELGSFSKASHVPRDRSKNPILAGETHLRRGTLPPDPINPLHFVF